MKKFASLLVVIIISLMFSPCFAESPNKIIINNIEAEIPAEMGSIKVFSDRTFVPVRFILEYFDYEVSWDEADEIVFGRNSVGDVFVMQVASPHLVVRQKGKQPQNIIMDVQPVLIAEEGRTYIPIRFIAEAIGYNVGYDDITGTVKLEK